MKKLIIISHPNLKDSVVNKRWIEGVEKYPDSYTIHHLESTYPDGKIDVEKEQALIESHGALIFQFPLYWYSTPPMLKLWLDSVFTYGWAYGSKATVMKNRDIAFSISLGGTPEVFTPSGKVGIPIDEIFSPYKAIARYLGAEFKGIFRFHGAEGSSTAALESVPAHLIEKGAKEYLDFLENI